MSTRRGFLRLLGVGAAAPIAAVLPSEPQARTSRLAEMLRGHDLPPPELLIEVSPLSDKEVLVRFLNANGPLVFKS